MYKAAFDEMLAMIKDEKPVNFKRAVFLAENAYLDNKLSYKEYIEEITRITIGLRKLINVNGYSHYTTAGNWAAHTFINEPLGVNNFEKYSYNYDDFMCRKDYTSGFLTTLMKTKKGNCHSLPMFFKILSEELGSPAYLAYAPLHNYIIHKDENDAWINVETTNGTFPDSRDVMRIFAVTPEQIKSGMYMTPLSDKESIVHCIADMLNYYQHKYSTGDIFMLSMIETTLAYFPNNHRILLEKTSCYEKMLDDGVKIKLDRELLKKWDKTYMSVVKKLNTLGHKTQTSKWYEEQINQVIALGKRLDAENRTNK
jgi:hypothetical protein